MSLFVDTSAIYAGIASNDAFHDRAVEEWTRLLERGEQLITHSLVEVESVALLQTRIGVQAVVAMSNQLLPQLQVVEIDRDERRVALSEIAVKGGRALSLVDRVSFDFMNRSGIKRAFSFDRHFAEAGFELVGPA